MKHIVPRSPISCMLTLLIAPLMFCALIIVAYRILFPFPEPLPLYESSSVEEICQVFGIDPDDEFCANPSEQNARTFDRVLQRSFPLETTFYGDIMSLVEVRIGRPSYELLGELGTSAVGFCPVEQEETERYPYYCLILFSSPVGHLTIHFDSVTGKVVRYVAWKTSGS